MTALCKTPLLAVVESRFQREALAHIHPFWGIAERDLFSATPDFQRPGLCSMKNNHMTQERRSWTNEDIWTLKSMPTKHPPAEIASELGRGLASVRAKAYENVHLFAKEAAQATDRSGASRLDMPSGGPRRSHQFRSARKRSRNVRFTVAGSTGQRNTSVKSLCWCFKLQGLTWSFV
jgi:hypothetical protein